MTAQGERVEGSPRAFLLGLLAAVVAVVIWRLKRSYSDAAVDDLRWILDPTARLVSLVTGARFEWESGQGYLSRERLFLIAKVCAGINFLIAAFGMTTWMLSRRAVSVASTTVVLGLSVPLAYAATVVVNAARIAFAMWMPMSAPMHRVEGIVFYFGGLLLLYEFLRPRERRSWVTPLCWYYAVTLAIPLANGAAGNRLFGAHAIVVLGAPPVFIALVALCMLSIRLCGFPARSFASLFWPRPPAARLVWERLRRRRRPLPLRQSSSPARLVNPAG